MTELTPVLEYQRLGIPFEIPSITINTRTNGKGRAKYDGMVVATMERLKGTTLGIDMQAEMPENEVDPAWREKELMWASVTHNGRTRGGCNLVSSRITALAANSITSQGPFVNFALGTSGQVATAALDLSISSVTTGVTTNEFTGATGLQRVVMTATPTFAVPASTIDSTSAVAMLKAFVNGSGGSVAVNGSALFDSLTVATSNMWLADIFASALNIVNSDTINVTWTVTL